jgi:hypothetical protein
MTTQWGDRTPLDAHYRKRGHDNAPRWWVEALGLAATALGFAAYLVFMGTR